jgi:hypothetical protein
VLLRGRAGGLSAGWVGDWRSLSPGRTVLLKLHDFDVFLARHAAVVLYSYRDVRDVLASTRRKFGCQPTLEDARRLLDQDRLWRASAHFTMRYESMLQNPQALARDLTAALGVTDCCPGTVAEEVGRLPAPDADSYDRETLLHPGHVTDGRHGSWHGWLAPELLARLEAEFGDWLSANGYPLTPDP